MSATIDHGPGASPDALEAAGRYEEAARAWEELAERARGPERAAALCHQARLLSGPLGRTQLGIRIYRRAFENDPDNPDALSALCEHASAAADWPLLGNVQRRRFGLAGEPRRRVQIALDAGRIEREQLHNPGSAREWFEAGLALDPDHVDLHEALADLDRERGDEAGLLRHLERVIELRADQPSPATLLESASLHAERGDRMRALAYLERASSLAPDDSLVLDALADVLVPLDRPHDLADVLERRAAIVSDDAQTRASVLAELGELLEQRLLDTEGALDAYERAHAADPDTPGVVPALARLRAKVESALGSAPQAEAVAVEPLAVEAVADEAPTPAPKETPEVPDDPEEALRAFEREAEVSHDRARLAVLVRGIARIHAERGTQREALPWVQRWVVAAPENAEPLRILVGLLDESSEAGQLAAALETLDPLLEPQERGAHRRRLGALYAKAGQLDEANRAYERALAVDPSNAEALEGHCNVLRRQERSEELAAALWRLADELDSRRRPSVLSELARVQDEIDDLPGAIETMARLERESDGPPDASDRLDALLARAGRLEVLEERLGLRAAQCDAGSAEAVALELRRATILADNLERGDEAAEVFQNVLIHAPESPEAKAGLERTLRSSIDATGLADFLADQAARASDPLVRDRSAFERAVILEELLDRPDDARDVFRDLSAQGSEPQVRLDSSRRYERLLERTGEWPALRAHLEGSLGRGTPAEDEDLHERLARLCADRLHDEAGELRHLERVVRLNPGRGDVWRHLADRYDHEGRTTDLARAMEAELEADTDAARELTVRNRLAELYLGSEREPERAALHYERLFELNPAHTTAARFLIGLYEREDRPADVIRLLEARLSALDVGPGEGESESASLRTAIRLQIARVRESQLHDLEGAISALEVALGEAGPSATVAQPLADAYERADYTQDLIALCQSAAAAASDPGERGNWLVRLGDAFLSRDRSEEAAHAYRQALTERPDDRVVQASLRELYRQRRDHEPLTRMLEEELAHLAGPAEIPVRMELAGLLSTDRPADALLHARRVLQLEPAHPEAFECSVAVAARLEQPEVALELLGSAIEREGSRARRAALHSRCASLLAGPLARPDEAADALRSALELDPTLRPERAELASLLEQRARWPELLECLELEARDARPCDRAALFEKGALIAWDRVAPDAALPWLERLRRERPNDPSVVWRMAEVHRGARRHEALLRTLADELATAPDVARQRELHLERAALLEGELASPGRALVALGDALALDPSDAEVLGRLDPLQAAQGLHADRATTLEAMIATTDGAARIPLHRELAELCTGALRDLDRAAFHWRAAIELVPRGGTAAIEILRALAGAHRGAGRTEDWADYAEQELAALEPTPVFDDRRRELRRALALAYDAELGRPDASLHHLRALLDAGEDELLGAEVVQQLEEIALRQLRAEGDPVELETRLARRLARDADDPPGWLELARLREERLLSPCGAFDAYRKALELDPRSRPALRGLRICAERLGRWHDVAEALELELDHPAAQPAAERGPLLRRLGDVCWHRLQSTTRASRAYAAALEVDGADYASLRALQRLLEAMEDWRGALDLYESEIEVLGEDDPTRRREVWLRVAALARDRTDEVERARRAYRHAAAIEPLATGDLYAYANLQDEAGDREGFASTFAEWCDRDRSDATCADHLRLARCLEELGRLEDALARIERAVTLDARDPAAWDTAGRLRHRCGDDTGSADALRRAAALANDSGAAERLLLAAERLEPEDGPGALEMLREAASRDPGALGVHTARARLAARLGIDDEAEESASRALDLVGSAPLDAETRIEVALVGGHAARARGRLEAAAGFYSSALSIDSDDAAASAAYGETLAALGDYAAARAALEARLAHADDYPERGQHLAILGRCLEAEGRLEEALDAYEKSLDVDAHVEEALEAAVRVRVDLDRVDEGIAALERWAAAATDSQARAERLLRAAEWELGTGGRQDSAESHLRAALAVDAGRVGAWTSLVRLLFDTGRLDEAIETADRSATHLQGDAALASVAVLQARAHEQAGHRPEAAEAFGVATEADPRCAEAALARARLLRGFGEWREAADTLAEFVEGHPEPDASELAEVHEQLGRLLAGPLEDVDGAVTSYRRAVALDDGRREARAALAELLSHRPGDWGEALAHHRILFEDDPADAASLRVALRIARGRGDADAISTGTNILRALGVASAYETSEDADRPLALSAAEPRLESPLHETLRVVAVEAAGEIAEALDTPGGPEGPTTPSDPEAAFRAAVLEVEGRLSAAALLPLPTRELAEVLTLIAALILDPDQVRGDGRLVNALSGALGRRLRRRLKRSLEGVELSAIREIDFEAWRTDLRALAAATALRETGCDLRTALAALLRDSADAAEADLRESADLSAVVTACPPALGLLRRVVRDWLSSV